jgi:hypothetical protein
MTLIQDLAVEDPRPRTEGGELKFEIYNGNHVGTAEWRSPGEVALEMDDPQLRAWFTDYFAREDTFLSGSVGDPQMSEPQRGDASASAFAHAAFRLAAHRYRIRQLDATPDEAQEFAS